MRGVHSTVHRQRTRVCARIDGRRKTRRSDGDGDDKTRRRRRRADDWATRAGGGYAERKRAGIKEILAAGGLAVATCSWRHACGKERAVSTQTGRAVVAVDEFAGMCVKAIPGGSAPAANAFALLLVASSVLVDSFSGLPAKRTACNRRDLGGFAENRNATAHSIDLREQQHRTLRQIEKNSARYRLLKRAAKEQWMREQQEMDDLRLQMDAVTRSEALLRDELQEQMEVLSSMHETIERVVDSSTHSTPGSRGSPT